MTRRILITCALAWQAAALCMAEDAPPKVEVFPPDVQLTTSRDRQSYIVVVTRPDGVTLDVTGAINRPPMERTAGVAALYELVRDVGRSMGRDVAEGATGGASDGNFTAAIGVPTIDGLGALGDGPHALHEHVIINELAPRAALVAGLIARIGDNGVTGDSTRYR